LERSGPSLLKRKRKRLHLLAVSGAAMKTRKKRLHVLVVVPGVQRVNLSRNLKTMKMKIRRMKRKKPLGRVARAAAPAVVPAVAVHGGQLQSRKKTRMKRKSLKLKSALHGEAGAQPPQRLQPLHAADHQGNQGRTRTTLLKIALPHEFA
jgi:hypothetical protein